MAAENPATDIPKIAPEIENTTAGIPNTTSDIANTTTDTPKPASELGDTTADIPDTATATENKTADVSEPPSEIDSTTAYILDTTYGVDDTATDMPETVSKIQNTAMDITSEVKNTATDTTSVIKNTAPDTIPKIENTATGMPQTTSEIPYTATAKTKFVTQGRQSNTINQSAQPSVKTRGGSLPDEKVSAEPTTTADRNVQVELPVEGEKIPSTEDEPVLLEVLVANRGKFSSADPNNTTYLLHCWTVFEKKLNQIRPSSQAFQI